MTTTKEIMEHVIHQYFEAWKTQNSNLLVSLFTNDGIYRVKPFGIEEYSGRELIKKYWEANPVATQERPQPQLLTSAFGDNISFVEWENQFRTQKGTHKNTRGILLMVFDNGKIKELREHYLSIEK